MLPNQSHEPNTVHIAIRRHQQLDRILLSLILKTPTKRIALSDTSKLEWLYQH